MPERENVPRLDDIALSRPDRPRGGPYTRPDAAAEPHAGAEIRCLARHRRRSRRRGADLECAEADFPGIPVISEENPASHGALAASCFFLVDPLDGTRAFINGTPDFCVSIGLVENGLPVAGALHGPIRDETVWAGESLWRACGDIARAEPFPVRAKPDPARPKIAIASKLHNNAETDRVLAELRVETIIRRSSALKFIALVAGEADFYPRRGRTMQWDIAAGDAILRAAGGGILDDAGQPLRYGFGETGWESPPFLALREMP